MDPPSELSTSGREVLSMLSVTKYYGGRESPVLQDLTLRVREGDVTEVRGANGAGKSTLLHLATGFSRPSQGTVVRSFRSLGYVHDGPPPRTRSTARSYLEHLGRVQGLPQHVVRTRLADLTAQLPVRPDLDAPLRSLSKGNLKKVLLLQAFLRPPAFLVLDEPTDGLDAPARATLREWIRKASDEGSAFLISSHGSELSDLADVLVLDNGHLRRGASGADPFTVTIRVRADKGLRSLLPTPASVAGEICTYLLDSQDVSPFLSSAVAAGAEILHLERNTP